MSAPPRIRSLNVSRDSCCRPILGPACNNARSADTKKPISKPQSKVNRLQEIEAKEQPSPPPISRQLEQLSRRNLSMSASCSSDASSDSSHSRTSTGPVLRRVRSQALRRKQCGPRTENVVNGGSGGDLFMPSESDGASIIKKKCYWVTPNTDPSYAAFHDEEWGVPVHNDKKLFELLCLSGALAELTWPSILNKRRTFREIFMDFDPVAVSKLNEKKITTPGNTAISLLSELKLRSVIENARQTCKIMDEYGSFDQYIWGFVNHKPIISHFQYPRQVPVKTSKADLMSKDLVKRGFRGVGPTVVYSFMQVSGMTNDHLISCFRFHECLLAADERGKHDSCKARVEEGQSGNKNSNPSDMVLEPSFG